MAAGAALDHVFDLARAPGLARKLRERPLPGGMLQVLRLAAGDEQSLNEVAAHSGRSVDMLKNAAQFYVVQVLFKPNADSYRVLGAMPTATRDELRSHMIWLLKYLHPDTTQGGQHAIFASRVTTAWETLKSAERREQYDERRARSHTPGPRSNDAKRPYVGAGPRLVVPPRAGRAGAPRSGRTRRWRRTLALAAIVGTGVGATAIWIGGDPGLIERANSMVFDLLRPTLGPQAAADRQLDERE